MTAELTAYLRRGRKKVQGYLERADAEAYYEILCCQHACGFRGSLVEIGLHHGRSFLALCLALGNGEKAYGIDIFERQDLNKDQSGSGDRAMLEANLRSFNIDPDRLVIDARASTEVCAEDILRNVGMARFFSIDGGHWTDVVNNDLRLAERTIAPHGIIALDDFLRPEWPEVSAGFFKWVQTRTTPLVPFAIGFNKLYLCHSSHVELYGGALRHSSLLRHFWSKDCELHGNKIPVYQRFPMTAWSWKTRLGEYLKIFHPELYLSLKSLRHRAAGGARKRPAGGA